MSDHTTSQLAIRHWVNWRSAVLAGTCVAGGLTLNMMVLAVTPEQPTEAVQVAASVQAVEPVPLDTGPVERPEVAGAADSTLAPLDTVVVPPTEPVSVPDAELSPPAVSPVRVPPAPATPVPQTTAPISAVPATVAEVAVSHVEVVATTATPTTALPTTVATTSVVPTTVARTTTVPTTAAPTTAAPTTAAPTTVGHTISYPSYTTRGGEIYLEVVDNREISVYSVVRGAGWVHEVDKNGPKQVEVKFFNVNTEREAEFHAEIEDGRIKVES